MNAVIKINNQINKDSIIKINSGVKQGGVLSPLLFNIFIHDLIEACSQMNTGVNIGIHKIAILAYCDDIVVVSNTLNGISELLAACDTYANEWLIKFNANKSNVLYCGVKIYSDDDIDLKINNTKLNVISNCKYLGVNINNKYVFNDHIMMKFDKVEK